MKQNKEKKKKKKKASYMAFQKKKLTKNQIKGNENSHLGRFEFLLLDDASFELDAVFELIITGFPFGCVKALETLIRRKPS